MVLNAERQFSADSAFLSPTWHFTVGEIPVAINKRCKSFYCFASDHIEAGRHGQFSALLMLNSSMVILAGLVKIKSSAKSGNPQMH